MYHSIILRSIFSLGCLTPQSGIQMSMKALAVPNISHLLHPTMHYLRKQKRRRVIRQFIPRLFHINHISGVVYTTAALCATFCWTDRIGGEEAKGSGSFVFVSYGRRRAADCRGRSSVGGIVSLICRSGLCLWRPLLILTCPRPYASITSMGIYELCTHTRN